MKILQIDTVLQIQILQLKNIVKSYKSQKKNISLLRILIFLGVIALYFGDMIVTIL